VLAAVVPTTTVPLVMGAIAVGTGLVLVVVRRRSSSRP
jgi:hypothetical protein